MSGATYNLSPELITIFTNLLTPTILMMAMITIYQLGRQFLRDRGTISRCGPEILIQNDNRPNQDQGGFAFIDIKEEHKSIFIDAMGGFADFAKLKGYSIEFSMDTSPP